MHTADPNLSESTLRLLLLDGVGAVLDGLCTELSNAGWPAVFTYRIHHCEDTRDASINRCCREIAALIETQGINVIVANYDIFANIGETQGFEREFGIFDLFTKDNLFSNMLPTSQKVRAGIKKIIIHTYDPGINSDIIDAREYQINQLFQREIAFFIELSSSFVRYDSLTRQLLQSPNRLPLNSPVRHSYELNFARIVHHILKEVDDKDGQVHHFSEQFDALEKIKNLHHTDKELVSKLKQSGDTETLKKLSGLSAEIRIAAELDHFSVGHVSFISNIKGNSEKHLLDIPYKGYYDIINPKLEKDNTWTGLYKDEQGAFLENEFVYFDYQTDSAGFQIYNFRASEQVTRLDRQTGFKEFLPYLHSSVFYDEDAWKSKQVIEVVKPAGQTSIKLFFLFSKLSNRSFSSIETLRNHLNFSLWCSDSEDYEASQVDYLFMTMSQSYFLPIRNIVQSTVMLSITDHIKEVEADKRKSETQTLLAREQLNFIKAHKHTIRNFGYELRLSNLRLALDLNRVDKALEILGYIEKLNLLRDITIDFIYMTNENLKSLLLYKLLQEQGFTFSAILKIIDEGQGLGTSNLYIAEAVSGHRANYFPEAHLIVVFNLLVNLYSNTTKHSLEDTDYRITLDILDGSLLIRFTTNTHLLPVYQKYLLTDATENPSEGQGLTIIKEAMGLLKAYLHMQIDSIENFTEITLTKQPYEMPDH